MSPGSTGLLYGRVYDSSALTPIYFQTVNIPSSYFHTAQIKELYWKNHKVLYLVFYIYHSKKGEKHVCTC
jgi:hypothetical protein